MIRKMLVKMMRSCEAAIRLLEIAVRPLAMGAMGKVSLCELQQRWRIVAKELQNITGQLAIGHRIDRLQAAYSPPKSLRPSKRKFLLAGPCWSTVFGCANVMPLLDCYSILFISSLLLSLFVYCCDASSIIMW
jgi:L-arabinose isomerase